MTKPQLIDDWRAAWRFLSVQASALNASLLAGWLALPEDLKASIPSWLPVGIALALLATSVVGRVIKQEPKP